MKLNISVSTKSGSLYLFTQDGDKFVFLRGIHEGEVVRFKEPLKIGNCINMEYYARSDYDYTQSKDISILRSTEITDITIMIS